MDGKKFRIGNADSLTKKKEKITKKKKKQNINPTWKILRTDVDLREATSFLDHVYLGCTQRECQISNTIMDN